MAAGAVGHDADVAVSALRDADRCNVVLDSKGRLVDDGAALVEDKPKINIVILQPLGAGGRRGPAGLLIVRGPEIDIPLRGKSLCQQSLDGLQKCRNDELVVNGAAGVDAAVVNLCAEGGYVQASSSASTVS